MELARSIGIRFIGCLHLEIELKFKDLKVSYKTQQWLFIVKQQQTH
jgi:hypothetical protein